MSFRFSAAAVAATLAWSLYACSTSSRPVAAIPAEDGGADGGASAYAFPANFEFGTAIAGFQADMGCPTLPRAECEDTNSDWFAFVTNDLTAKNKDLHISGQAPGVAGPGFWELYDADIGRAATELHNQGLRFSVEWSRVFPTSTEDVEGYEAMKARANAAALEKYHSMFAALKARGMKPLVTVNHYALPTWIHDAIACHQDIEGCKDRGWLDRSRIVKEIAKYAGFLGREFGGEVDQWATLNEPMAVVLPGYVLPGPARSNPPGVSYRGTEARVVLGSMIEAHARMYDALHAADTVDADGDGRVVDVGIVYNVLVASPKDEASAVDKTAAENVYYLWNLAFLNAVGLGQYDEDLDGVAEEREDLKNRLDYLGVNYYGRAVVTGAEIAVLPQLSPKTTFSPTGLVFEPIYPAGLYDVMLDMTRRYKRSIVITENGTEFKASDPPETVEKYVVDHLRVLRKSMNDGADVRGYYYWTLMDNYEWNHGMNMRIGLYGVDPNDPTKARTLRRAGTAYAAIAKNKAIPADLLAKYPEAP